MKNVPQLLRSNPQAKMAGAYLAATATVAFVALAASNLFSRANAAAGLEVQSNTQVAEIHQLQAGFHHASSFGGDIEAMMALWAENSSITAGGVVYAGKDGVRDFFATHAAPFKHYWVALAPVFKTDLEIHGDAADIYFECHLADPSVTPYVLRADLFARGTLKKVNGEWLFGDITIGAAPPLGTP